MVTLNAMAIGHPGLRMRTAERSSRNWRRWSSWSPPDDGSVIFRLGQQAAKKNLQLEILRADEGQYVNGVWQTTRIWNGDQTDRGLNFERTVGPAVVRIRLHTLPLLADEAAKSPTTKDRYPILR